MVWHAIIMFIVLANGRPVSQEIEGRVVFNTQRECLLAASHAGNAMLQEHSDIIGYSVLCEPRQAT